MSTPRPSAPPPPASGGSGPAATALPKLGKLEAKFQPPRIILNAVEGWGKTTAGAYAPNPAILMARGETGYTTLLGAGSVPSVDAALIDTWPELLAIIDDLVGADRGYGSIVLDAMGGFERLCHEHVCRRDFGGDWGEKGFAAYAKGFDRAAGDWLQLLARLEKLRDARGVPVIVLTHSQVKPFKNPIGTDFDRYVADCHPKTWAPTSKWADCVLFGNHYQIVEEKQKGRAKGVGGNQRVIHTEHNDAWDAKNRYGMPAVIDIPDDYTQVWSTIWAAIKGENNA